MIKNSSKHNWNKKNIEQLYRNVYLMEERLIKY
jgi:hypothetical protein